MKLAVVLPSRGLIYSQTVEELYRELESIRTFRGDRYKVFFSHGRPIPECFNIPTEQALEDDFSHVLFVEEDMVLPRGILQELIDREAPAVACDYPVSGGSGGTVMYDQEGRALFTGCGLLLVEADLLRRLPKPIWRSDIEWKPVVDDGLIYFTVSYKGKRAVYGQQDVAFGLRLYANGMPIEVLGETIGQREMVRKGAKGSNDGYHVVEDRMEVAERRDLQNIPVRRQFKEIMIDGKRVKVKDDHLKKLSGVTYPDYIQSLSAIFDPEPGLRDWLLVKD